MSNPQIRGVRAAIRVAVRATLTLSALVAVSAAVAHAQPVTKDPAGQPPAGAGRGQGGRGMQALFEGITLTEAQQKSVDSLNTAFREKAQAAGQGADRRAMMEERTKAIKTILTPEQAKTYDANVEKMRANRPGGAL
jgi:Spy/CpxP family protein refolding chaperone